MQHMICSMIAYPADKLGYGAEISQWHFIEISNQHLFLLSVDDTMSQQIENVIVIGTGGGGSMLVRELAKVLPATHRLIAISRESFGFYAPGSLRASVEPAIKLRSLHL